MYDLGIEIDEEELGQLVASSKSMSMKNYKCVAASNLGESMNQDIDYQDISQEQLDEILNVTTEETNNSISSKKMLKAANKSTVNKQVDLVLIIDSTGSMGSYIAKVKSNLAQLISDLRKQNVFLYVSVVDYKDITCDGNNSTKVNNNLNVDFMNNINDMSKVLGTVSATGGGDGPETALDAVGATLNLKFRTNASKYAFIITDASTKLDNNYGVVSMFDAATKLKNKGIYTSVITGSYYKSHYVDIYEKSNGIWIDLATNFNNDMYNFILNGSQSATKYSAILSSGLTSVTLDTPLTKDSDTDTDLDGIPDSDEVDWTYITEEVGEDGKPQIKLLTLGTLIEKGVGCSLDGLSKMPLLSLILKLQVLPVESSPISEDGDGDYYLDIQDDNPLQSDPMFIDDEAIIDTYHAEDIEMNFVEGNENNSIRFMSYAKIESTDKISDGKLTYEDPFVPKQPDKGYIIFTRETRQTLNANDCDRYKLTPNYNSDYKFYVENVGDSNDIKIKVYKGNSTNNRDLIKANTSYGSSWFYSLEAKQTYTIYVYQKNSSVKPYEFRVEQDNWVKNTDGGVWIEENKSGTKTLRQFYLTNEQLRVYDHIRREGKNQSSLFSNLVGNGGFTIGGIVETIIANKILPKKLATANSETVTAACWIYATFSLAQGAGEYIDEEYYLSAYEKAIDNNIGILYYKNPSLYGMEYYWTTWKE